MKKPKIIIFGVGGILLKDGSNPMFDILCVLGKEHDARMIQEEYEKRKEVGPWGLAQYAELFRGVEKEKITALTVKYLSEYLRPRFQEVILELRRRGYVVGVMTAHPDFVVDALEEIYDFDFAQGTVFEYENDMVTGNLVQEFNRYDKGDAIQALAETFSVTPSDIAIVANSITQVPVIERVGGYVAFNQKKDLGKKFDYEIPDGDPTKLLAIFV
ncbi:MAG: hypothetical protein A2V96_01540 [Candidatus Yonathbacteria bacterium RBG_16_43_6]|uniref:Uncharacterized protein n=2 Tax=Parcubacteria group TaxID=1794811 RepID=A0A1G2SEN1_9BACT|nr:MAG: HAD-superfamily hydrolase, subfamily IB (PSPase-like) [Candidatus Azambacteria bacterium GW2011_GWA1_44_9]OHA78824.1 MAG: hypothetical protein A2658_00315 [Candidatus Yonathbacteria bacterium RIFCSPHIGHO2_01_FULL_44_19]OHA79452.1 MAG: hypothetical protein A2V96_01540 [Candidatus Yonathbacteria bacterium RBG_16_43_6]OHA82901.1 MAG: hypothetical protein A3B07_03365 [Candidatus Yonathbacteria bacterium RIFCSPLOWO2_01_FULL_43_27]